MGIFESKTVSTTVQLVIWTFWTLCQDFSEWFISNPLLFQLRREIFHKRMSWYTPTTNDETQIIILTDLLKILNTFAGLCCDGINCSFDMSQHLTLAFRQTAVVVHHKTLFWVSSGWLDAGILRLGSGYKDGQHQNTEEQCGETRSRKHLRIIAQ